MMNPAFKMQELWVMSNAVLFANPVDAINFDVAILAQVKLWRPTFGGKLMAILNKNHEIKTSARRWEWPIVPIGNIDWWINAEDVWATGSALDLMWERNYSKLIVPEVNHRRSHSYEKLNDAGEPVTVTVECISKKIDHRVIWAERRSGLLVTDPLHVKTFEYLEEALAATWAVRARFKHDHQSQPELELLHG
jgi:hypothetical protein